MAIINMTKTCKANGITTFARTRGGWMKLIEGYDKSEYGGYRFVGSNFIKVGNYETEINNGLYLDCSKHFDKETKTKTEIMNLFKIQDGEVELLNTIPKATKGWASTFEADVEEYFSASEVTALDVLNVIRDMTCNRDILHEIGRELLKEERKTTWLNLAHFGAYMNKACVYRADYSLHEEKVEEMAVSLYHNSHEAKKYFNYEINNDYQLRMLYSFIHCKVGLKQYADFQIEYEDIAEDHYLKMSNLEKLRNYNYNEISRGATHDRGYWISFDDGIYANECIIYIIVPNVAHETIKIQRMRLQLL